MQKRRILHLILMVVSIMVVSIFAECIYKLVDPFHRCTDGTPLVYIQDNLYQSSPNRECIDQALVGDFLGSVRKKIYFKPNKNGFSNFLDKGTKLYKLKDSNPDEKIVVLYKGNYYELIDSRFGLEE